MDVFGQLNDPRIDHRKLHPLPEILLLTLCAVICGAESWDDIELFGNAKLDFLRTFLPFENGIPSDDTLRRFFRAIDSKTLRGSHDKAVIMLSPSKATKKVYMTM